MNSIRTLRFRRTVFYSALVLFLSLADCWAPGAAFAALGDGYFSAVEAEPRAEFCAEWNPDFHYNGFRCCSRYIVGSRLSRINQCHRQRVKAHYCGDRTSLQKEYEEAVSLGKVQDILEVIDHELGLRGQQSFCGVNNGFLAYGRRLMPTSTNRILVKSARRCLDYGTDSTIGFLEWLGREVAKKYVGPFHGVRLVVGNISAPRGGCIAGRFHGKRAHASHTSGLDVDLGFIVPQKGTLNSGYFTRSFDPDGNLWLLSRMFKNPYACVKAAFLDKRHIQVLEKRFRNRPDWKELRRFVRHMPGHQDHFHLRLGEGPGLAGCKIQPAPELESHEDENNGEDDVDPWNISWLQKLYQKYHAPSISSTKGA